MVKLTQEEIWASNILKNQIESNKAELQRTLAAQDAFIKLLEQKYNATFNPTSGLLEPKEPDKKETR